MQLLLLRVATAAKVETSGIDVKLLRKPADALQRTELSDTQRDSEQQVPPTEILNDVECDPNPAPVTLTRAAPVDGKMMLAHEKIPGGCRSWTLVDETFLTMETSEIMMPGLSVIEGDIFAAMLESQNHIDASAEEKLLSNRARELESQMPKPDPTTVTREAAVTAEMVELT
jgi:hypothetical protein